MEGKAGMRGLDVPGSNACTYAIHCTKRSPDAQQMRDRRIVEKRKDVKRPLTKPSATPAK